ncbi:MAG: hypothetical protein P4M09_22870 [Devosia sp.]|nr:hypothetical protein [Devosia sp.]
MRTALSITLVLALTGGAVAGSACDNLPPIDKMRTPTNPFNVSLVSQSDLIRLCGLSGPGVRGACAVPDNMDWKHHATVHWSIYLDKDDPEQDCLLTYEEAHLAPNNWFDPLVESHKLW